MQRASDVISVITLGEKGDGIISSIHGLKKEERQGYFHIQIGISIDFGTTNQCSRD